MFCMAQKLACDQLVLSLFSWNPLRSKQGSSSVTVDKSSRSELQTKDTWKTEEMPWMRKLSRISRDGANFGQYCQDYGTSERNDGPVGSFGERKATKARAGMSWGKRMHRTMPVSTVLWSTVVGNIIKRTRYPFRHRSASSVI